MNPEDTALERIAVVGTTGSGKTTLAAQLAERLGLEHVELDNLHWEPNWTPASEPVFRERVTKALCGERWAVDGNYSAVRDLVWARADTLVWLDYPFAIVMRRLTWRTFRRILSREPLWNDNRERVWVQFFSGDSIFLWAIQTHWKQRGRYERLTQDPSHRHLYVLRFRSPGETKRWLEGLTRLPVPEKRVS